MKVREYLEDIFCEVEDPRKQRCRKYELIDILAICLIASVAGCESCVEFEEYGEQHKTEFKELLGIRTGIPSHDTFGRVLSLIDSKGLENSLSKLAERLKGSIFDETIAIDGKVLRRSYDKAKQQDALHLVSAFGSATRLVFAQRAVDCKSNEIKAIPEILDFLHITGQIITIDAMGCQTAIAEKIIKKEAEYVLALKGNQTSLHSDVATFFNEHSKNEYADIKHDQYTTVEKDHGRIEERVVTCSSDYKGIRRSDEFKSMQTIVRVDSKVFHIIKNKETTMTRFFISSLPANAEKIGKAIRSHWGIENSLHWVLDFTFNEDYARNRKDQVAHNFAVLRRLALNIVRRDDGSKSSLRIRRKKAGWDFNYLKKLIFGDF